MVLRVLNMIENKRVHKILYIQLLILVYIIFYIFFVNVINNENYEALLSLPIFIFFPFLMGQIIDELILNQKIFVDSDYFRLF